MLVQSILKTKADPEIYTVSPRLTLAEVSSELAAHKVGVVIVSSDGRRLEGILSERDVVRALAQEGAEALHMVAGDVMTQNPITCVPEDTVLSVMERMDLGGFRHMPVIDHGALMGVISIRDVVRARLIEIDRERAALTGMIAGQ